MRPVPNKCESIGPPWWGNKPVVVVGEGPSRIGFDLTQVQGKCHVLAVKGAMFELKWADMGFGIDIPRYRQWRDRIEKELSHLDVWWGVDRDRPIEPLPNVRCLLREHGGVLSEERNRVMVAGTSGYAALNIAYHKQAREIYLVGFDYQWQGNKAHANEQVYDSRRNHPRMWAQWAKSYGPLGKALKVRGIQVWNASPTSLIEAFQKITLDELVTRLQ